MLKSLICLSLYFCFSTMASASISMGNGPKSIILEGKLGGRITGEMWTSQTELANNKVNLFFYIDPDNRTLNDDLAERLKAENFPRDRYASTVVINMGATWLPNEFLEATLKRKQKQYPDTTYVKDLDKTLVKEWGLPDNSYSVMAFDKEGKLWYSRDGKFSEEQIDEVINGIKARLN